MVLMRRQQINIIWILSFVVFLGFLLRISSIFHHLSDSNSTHVDELFVVGAAFNLRILDLNPNDFVYPHLLYYLLLPLFSFCNLFLSSALMNFLNLDLYATDIVIGRAFIVATAILHIIVVYAIGKRLFNYQAGLIAALFLALNPLHASLSYTVKPDMLMSLLILIGFLFICDLYTKEKLKSINYILIASFIGLATAAKYIGILGIAPLFVVHYLKSRGKIRFLNRNLFLALFFVGLIFFLANPFIILDFRHFLKDIVPLFNSSSRGYLRTILVPRGWINYPIVLLSCLGPGIFILAIFGLILSIWKHSKKDILILSFPATYYFIMGAFKHSPAWYLLPIIPFILLLAAQFLMRLADIISRVEAFKKIKYGVILLLLCLIFALPSLGSIIHYNKWINQKDTRILARDWIKSNISPGSRILLGYGIDKNINLIVGEITTHYQIDSIEYREAVEYKEFFEDNNPDFIVVEAGRSRYKVAEMRPLYDFIEDNFLLVKEIKPFVDMPNHPFIYKFYNPHIKIYDCK